MTVGMQISKHLAKTLWSPGLVFQSNQPDAIRTKDDETRRNEHVEQKEERHKQEKDTPQKAEAE